MLELRLLGQFDVRRDGAPIDIPSRPAQSLLAYLALSTGTAHRREKLSGLLWPEASESNARSNLRHSLWRIRQALSPGPGEPPDFLQADNISISFQPSQSVWLDTVVLDRPLRPDTPLPELIECVRAYGGELLPGFYDDWVVLERERMRATVERKIQILLDRLLEARRWSEAIEWGERWIALGYLPEPAYRALMRAHAGIGDLSAVAAVYQRCRDALRQELGVEPSEQTRALYDQLSASQRPPASVRSPGLTGAVAGSAPPVRALLQSWRRSQVEVLDLASLALVHAAQDREPLAFQDTRLVIRSALHHDVDVGPWVERAAEPRFAAAALEEALREYPKPAVRMRIVQALEGLAGPEADAALLGVVQADDAAAVKSAAALAAARRGNAGQVVDLLLGGIRGGSDPAALAALVVVADEVGLPQDAGPFPRLPFLAALLQRRWTEKREVIFRQVGRGGLGAGLLLMLHGAASPLYMALGYPELYRRQVAEFPFAAWSISGAFAMLFVGGCQGMVSALMAGLADALGGARSSQSRRLMLGCLAGLFHSVYLISFSLTGLLDPVAGPEIFIPVYVLYGMILGALLSTVVPELGTRPPARHQLTRALQVAAPLAAATILVTYVGYRQEMIATLPNRLMFAMLLPLGLGLGLASLRSNRQRGP